MALDPNIPLSVEQVNPLYAIQDARTVKQQGLQNQQTEQSIDQTGREMERQSLIDGAIQLNTFLQKDDFNGALRFLEGREGAILARGGDPTQTRQARQMLTEGKFGELKNEVQSILALNEAVESDPAAWQMFQRTAAAAGLEPGTPEYIRAARIEAGLEARAMGAAPKTTMIGGVPYEQVQESGRLIYRPVTIGSQEMNAEQVGEDSATIKAAETKATEQAKRDQEIAQKQKLYNSFETAFDTYLSYLDGTMTGPITGLIPGVTSSQQLADKGKDVLKPVLKAMTKMPGEGSFTDKDADDLFNQLPDRRTHPEAREPIARMLKSLLRARFELPPLDGGQGSDNQKYQVGQIITIGNKRFRVTGGDLDNDPDVEEVR